MKESDNIMGDLVTNMNEESLQILLSPMMNILDKKNIAEGVSFVEENSKLYICFDKDYLSKCNRLIIDSISAVYNEDFFHSDNRQSPNSDRLEYWCPDEWYDEETQITKRCRAKKMVVLELDMNDRFTILGTSIMLANNLREQDPMELKVNIEKLVLENDLIERHEHYIASGYPDLGWINLSIILNKDNSLRENPYATRMSICEINSTFSCDNVILATLGGYEEKTYITFNMDKEELEKNIEEHFGRKISSDEQNNNDLLEMYQKQLLKK